MRENMKQRLDARAYPAACSFCDPMTRRALAILTITLLGLSAVSILPAATANTCTGTVDTGCGGTCGTGCGYGCSVYFNTGIGLVRTVFNIVYGSPQYCWG